LIKHGFFQELSKEESSPEGLQKKVSVTDKENQGGMVNVYGKSFSFIAACCMFPSSKVDPMGGVMITQPSFMTNFWQEGANQILITG